MGSKISEKRRWIASFSRSCSKRRFRDEEETLGIRCATVELTDMGDTVDGWNPANQLRLVVYPIIYRVSAPSQVVQDFSHQQYEIHTYSPANLYCCIDD